MNKFKDLVSVIVPVYNSDKYLSRCVKSIINQTYLNLEIILVDDGSSDSCPMICDAFAKEDERVHVTHIHNSGTAGARNFGLDLAKGEWICFVDSDDFIANNFLEILLNAAKQGNCLIAQCKFRTCSGNSIMEEKRTSPKITYLEWHEYFFHCAFTENHHVLSVCSNIYHSSLFNEIRFPLIRRSEDNLAASQLLWAARDNLLAVVDCQMYYYCRHIESKTRKKADFTSLGVIESFEMNLSYWEKRKETDICNWYRNFYFSCLIHTYLIICRDNVCIDVLPFLEEKLKSNLPNAISICHEKIVLPLGIEKVTDDMMKRQGFIMYGLGYNGTYILPWLHDFGFKILEIWDRSARIEYCLDGIKVCNAHENIHKNVTILITIADQKIAVSIARNLRELGYCNFIYHNTLDNILKYLQYKTYIPFLLEIE